MWCENISKRLGFHQEVIKHGAGVFVDEAGGATGKTVLLAGAV